MSPAWVYLAALAQAGVGGCGDLGGRPIHIGIQWAEVWQALDNGANCTQNCHLGSVPAAGLNLSNPRFSQLFLVGQTSAQGSTLLVDPGRPENSLFLHKVNCSAPGIGGPMPPGGSLSIALQEMIHDWIDQGAYGEAPEDALLRDFVFRGQFESLRF